jgi:hypothetical protein
MLVKGVLRVNKLFQNRAGELPWPFSRKKVFLDSLLFYGLRHLLTNVQVLDKSRNTRLYRKAFFSGGNPVKTGNGPAAVILDPVID